MGFGVRRKPRPDGRPGFPRVDTVHLGDPGGRKGACVINVVDEVTHFQHQNGSIVRRWPGHIRVSHDLVPQLDAFLRDSLCPLLNFLRPGVTFKALGQLASTTTGHDAAKAVQRARDALFRAIGKARDSAA